MTELRNTKDAVNEVPFVGGNLSTSVDVGGFDSFFSLSQIGIAGGCCRCSEQP